MLQLWGIFCKFGTTFATKSLMKKLVYIFVFAALTSVSGFAQEINWVTLEKAMELQKKKPKKIMMDVYTNWCGPCKMLDKNTFQTADVANYVNENYYAVKFNAEGNETINYKGKVYSNPGYNPELASRRNWPTVWRSFYKSKPIQPLFLWMKKGMLLRPFEVTKHRPN